MGEDAECVARVVVCVGVCVGVCDGVCVGGVCGGGVCVVVVCVVGVCVVVAWKRAFLDAGKETSPNKSPKGDAKNACTARGGCCLHADTDLLTTAPLRGNRPEKIPHPPRIRKSEHCSLSAHSPPPPRICHFEQSLQ